MRGVSPQQNVHLNLIFNQNTPPATWRIRECCRLLSVIDTVHVSVSQSVSAAAGRRVATLIMCFFSVRRSSSRACASSRNTAAKLNHGSLNRISPILLLTLVRSPSTQYMGSEGRAGASALLSGCHSQLCRCVGDRAAVGGRPCQFSVQRRGLIERRVE